MKAELTRSRGRRVALAASLWIFSIATTVLLIGLWGRAVTGNPAALEESAHAAFRAEELSDRITEWVTDALDGAAVLSDTEIGAVVEKVRALPEADHSIDLLVDEFVEAAMSPPGNSVELDVVAALRPLEPVIVSELGRAGVEVDRATVTAGIERVAAVTLSAEVEPLIAGVASEARTVLTRVFVLSSVIMVVSGLSSVALSEGRLRMLRSLAFRLGVSALSFALILRIGSWALDPEGGRSPFAAGASVLLRSNGRILLVITAAAAAGAAIGTVALRRRRAAEAH